MLWTWVTLYEGYLNISAYLAGVRVSERKKEQEKERRKEGEEKEKEEKKK